MPRSTKQATGSSRRTSRCPALEPRREPESFELVFLLWVSRSCWFRTQACEPRSRVSGERVGSQAIVATPGGGPRAVPDEADAAALRAETLEQLKAFEPTSSTDATTNGRSSQVRLGVGARRHLRAAGDTAALSSTSSDPAVKKSLPALLQDRLRWLNEYDAARLALQKATHPEPSPEQQAAEAKAECRNCGNILTQAAQRPRSLLPPLFRDVGQGLERDSPRR